MHEHDRKPVINRLSRAIGHLSSVKKMVEDGRDCDEVLVQLEAVASAIRSTEKIILEDHIKHCIVDAVRSGDMERVDELNKAIDKLL
ncbi:MAG: metal-sensing transcriptional repressor [Eubacteriales bacterium]|nr:metal-sensing transcriptional repressor [Eubacteriales bacterium]